MKRPTIMLVVVGLLLFVAGGGIAFVTVVHATKNPTTSGTATGPTTALAVVATTSIASGTTGQEMVGQNLVAIKPIPIKQAQDSDITSFGLLSDQKLSSSVVKGQAILTSDLTPTTSSIQPPAGMQSIAVTMTGVEGLAGYLTSGSLVDIYANITKLSTLGGTGSPWAPAALYVPCTELIVPDVEVLDVSQILPPLGPHPSSSGRTPPTNETFLLAVTPAQAQIITFMTQNETLSVAQTQAGVTPVASNVCMGTGQYSVVP